MSSKYAKPSPGPTQYDWCKKKPVVVIPHPGDPWPPWFDAYLDYWYDDVPAKSVRVAAAIRLVRQGVTYNWYAITNQGDLASPGTVEVRLTLNPTTHVCNIFLNAWRPLYVAPQRAAYNVPIPDAWQFAWSGPPWSFAPTAIKRDILRFTPSTP